MHGARIENLSSQNWRGLSPEERLAALQQLENSLAAQEGRKIPCEVKFILDSEFKSPEERQTTFGYHVGNVIYINKGLVDSKEPSMQPELFDPEEPYMATETLLHESRHAYQDHVANNPHLVQNQQQLDDFQKNRGNGYIDPQESSAYYLAQPKEIDARSEARQSTDAYFSDDSAYREHQTKMQRFEEANRRFCEDEIGPNYEEDVRRVAYFRHDVFEAQKQTASAQETGSGPAGTTKVSQPTTVPERGASEEAAQKEGQTQAGAENSTETSDDYSYGYGY